MKTEQQTAELPGIPTPPKKRGRPSTGTAQTPAQRKAASRARLMQWQKEQVFGSEDFRMLSPGQIMDILPRLWAAGDFEAVQWAAIALKLEADTAHRKQHAKP